MNDLHKYHIRIDRAQCDNLCVGLPQFRDGNSTVNTCAVVYERDADFGELDVIETVGKNQSVMVTLLNCYQVKKFPLRLLHI